MNLRAHLALTISNDTDHPLNQHFTLLPSGRRYTTSGRYKSKSKTKVAICNLELKLHIGFFREPWWSLQLSGQSMREVTRKMQWQKPLILLMTDMILAVVLEWMKSVGLYVTCTVYCIYRNGIILVDTEITSSSSSFIGCRLWQPTGSHQLKPELCLHIKLVYDIRSRLLVSTKAKWGARGGRGETSGGCWRVCEAVACVPSTSRPRGRHMVPTAAMVKR